MGFSPDGKWLAYQIENRHAGLPPSFNLLSHDGELISYTLSLPQDQTPLSSWVVRWINNEKMLLLTVNSSSSTAQLPNCSLMILNPLTGELQQTLLNSLPGYKEGDVVYFSPDMTKVVYLAVDDDQPESLVLWDIATQRALWRKAPVDASIVSTLWYPGGFAKRLMWSPDSMRFFVTVRQLEEDGDAIQFISYLIDRNGEQEQVINYEPGQEDQIIHNGSWSPNGRYLAYITYNKDQEEAHALMLYDRTTGSTMTTCTAPELFADILWSFDGNYLAYMAQAKEQRYLLTLNVQTRKVTKVSAVKNLFFAGWVENEAWLTP